ncbi:VanW family protein [Cellulomonas denverensis]|uniref:VanW family protein n=1 Tax=Cellulomonas denverensis TaxID=264297 RepID=UPI0035EAC812
MVAGADDGAPVGEGDGVPTSDGDGEVPEGGAPVGDDAGAREGDEPVGDGDTEAPVSDSLAGEGDGEPREGNAPEAEARQGGEPAGDPAPTAGGGDDPTDPTTTDAEGAAAAPVSAAGEGPSVDQPDDAGAPAAALGDAGATGGPADGPSAATDSTDDRGASSAEPGAAVAAEPDRPGTETSVAEAAPTSPVPTSPVPTSPTADAEPPATSTASEALSPRTEQDAAVSEAPTPRPEQGAALSERETGSPRPEQDAAASGREAGTPKADGSNEPVVDSPAPAAAAASGAAADAAPSTPGRAPIASRLGADSTAESETAGTAAAKTTAHDEADDATTVLPVARDTAGTPAGQNAPSAVWPAAAQGTAAATTPSESQTATPLPSEARQAEAPTSPDAPQTVAPSSPDAPQTAASSAGAPAGKAGDDAATAITRRSPPLPPPAPHRALPAVPRHPGTPAPSAPRHCTHRLRRRIRCPHPAREEAPLDVFDEEPAGKRRWWRPVLIVAGVLVVLGGAYVGGAYALADRVPRGTTVAGIEVGGMSAQDARTALTEGLAERSSQPITVTAREVSGTVDPATAGLTFDVEATVDSLTGIDLRPQRMWQHLAGGGAESPVTEVDEGLLDAAIEDLSGSLTLAPVDGSVVFVDGQPQGVAAVDGWSLDTEGARSTLEDGWLTEALPIELPSDTVTPAITQDEVDRVVRDVASAVVSGPVTVSVAGQNAELPVDVVTAAASFVPQDSQLVLQIDGAALVEQVVSRTTDLLTTAADATFEFQDGAPVIVPGTPGTTLDPAALATAVATAASSTSERTATVELVESDPAQSTQALEELGVKEAISEFSTPLTSEPRRTQNIAAGAAAINGTLIRPGETFSLTEALGPIDAAHGFVQAGAIVNGEHSDAWGGGLSQLSTTTFNAAFEAGMEDVEHTPHSEWFQRYPAGREATLYTGSIDMKWKNTSPYGVLVQAYVADGKTWVRLWSTHHFDVEITSGAKTNVVSPTTVYNTSPTCSAQSAGNPGFSISVTRNVLLNGQVQSTDNLSWRYKPQNRVVCGPDPASQAAAG